MVKKYTYVLAAIVAIISYLITTSVIRLTEVYGFISLVLLYITLIISPLYRAFPNVKGKKLLVQARPALGISAFVFGVLHGTIGLFKLLGGFSGLTFLSRYYALSITCGAVALFILLLMASSSNNYVRLYLGKWWKWIHNAVYLAGVLIVVHMLMLGSHFRDLSAAIPALCYVALAIFLLLEGLRIDAWFTTKYPHLPRSGAPFILIVVLLVIVGMNLYDLSFDVHTQHETEIVEQYSVAVNSQPKAGEISELKYALYNTSGQVTTATQAESIILSYGLDQAIRFEGTQDSNGFISHINFSSPGTYSAFARFKLSNGSEQVVPFEINVQ